VRCPRCGGKVVREDSIFLRQPEYTCIMCGWNDSRPTMSAEEADRDTRREADRGYCGAPGD
jgi:hypothetical protein